VTLVKTQTAKIALQPSVPNVKPISSRTLKDFALNVEKIAMNVMLIVAFNVLLDSIPILKAFV